MIQREGERRSGVGSLVTALAVLLLAACGVKTPPQPLETVLPPPAQVGVRQRPESAWLSWVAPAHGGRAFGGVRGYVIRLERLPYRCTTCRPEGIETVAPAADAPRLVREGGRLYYPLSLAPRPSLYRVSVAVRYGRGTGPASPPALVDTAVDIPAAELAAQRLREAVRLYWPRPQERLVHTIAGRGAPEPRVRRYRANVYRRRPPQPWPLTPLNGQPLEAAQWLVPRSGGDTDALYTVRLVDSFGNEGAAAPPVRPGSADEAQ